MTGAPWAEASTSITGILIHEQHAVHAIRTVGIDIGKRPRSAFESASGQTLRAACQGQRPLCREAAQKQTVRLRRPTSDDEVDAVKVRNRSDPEVRGASENVRIPAASRPSAAAVSFPRFIAASARQAALSCIRLADAALITAQLRVQLQTHPDCASRRVSSMMEAA